MASTLAGLICAAFAAPAGNFYTDAATGPPRPKDTPAASPTHNARETATPRASAPAKPPPGGNFYLDQKPAARKATSPGGAASKTAAKADDRSSSVSREKLRADAKGTSAGVVAERSEAKGRTPEKKVAAVDPKATPKPVALAAAPAVAPARIRDAYGLSEYFPQLWDLVSFVLIPEKISQYRTESARRQVVRIGKTLAKVSEVVERREKNLRNAAVAVYLLGNANSGLGALRGEGTLPHLLAVRSTLVHDARAFEREAAVYEILRSAENRAAERMRGVGRKRSLVETARSLAVADLNPHAVTWSPATLYPGVTQSLIVERGLEAEALEELAAAKPVAAARWNRVTLASLAPGAPDLLGQPMEGGPGGNYALAPRSEVSEDAPIDVERPKETALRIRTGTDRTIRAAADGTVAYAGALRGVGKIVVLEHPTGLFSVYENLENVRVGEGQSVRRGQPVGEATPAEVPGEGWMRFQVRRGVEVVPAGELLGAADPALVLAGPGTR